MEGWANPAQAVCQSAAGSRGAIDSLKRAPSSQALRLQVLQTHSATSTVLNILITLYECPFAYLSIPNPTQRRAVQKVSVFPEDILSKVHPARPGLPQPTRFILPLGQFRFGVSETRQIHSWLPWSLTAPSENWLTETLDERAQGQG